MKKEINKLKQNKLLTFGLLILLIVATLLSLLALKPTVTDDNLPEKSEEILEKSDLVYKSYNENVYWIDKDLSFEDASEIVDKHFDKEGYVFVREDESAEEFLSKVNGNLKGLYGPSSREDHVSVLFLKDSDFKVSTCVDQYIEYSTVGLSYTHELARVIIIDYSDYAQQLFRGKLDSMHVANVKQFIDLYYYSEVESDEMGLMEKSTAEALVAYLTLLGVETNENKAFELGKTLAENYTEYHKNMKYLIFDDVVVAIIAKDANVIMEKMINH